MTAEIAIMNRDAVAMAADSAVTSYGPSGHKVFTTANKIFALSNHCPVGIMFYASAAFMGIPWETVVKMYRHKYGTVPRDRLQEFADHFIDYLQTDNGFITPEIQLRHVRFSVASYFHEVIEDIKRSIQEEISKKGALTTKDIERVVGRTISRHHKQWISASRFDGCPDDYLDSLNKTYGKHVTEIRKAIFEDVPMDASAQKMLMEIAYALFVKYPEGLRHTSTSGVVIAGFGTQDVFPSLASFEIEGMAAGFLKLQKEKPTAISIDQIAVIRPFAQADDVFTFMEGVSPNYQSAIERDLQKVFEQFSKEELGHKKKLEAIKSGNKIVVAAEKVQDLKIGDYIVEVKTSRDDLSYQEALIVAMKEEKAAFRLYTDLAEKTDDPAAKEIFLMLAQEEARHKLRFEIEYDDYILTEN